MSFEKIEKEILTDALIKQDVIYQFKTDGHAAINIILGGISVFFIFLFSLFSPYVWIALAIPAALLAISYIRRAIKLSEIKNGNFIVITDTLLYEKQGEVRMTPTFYKSRWVSYMQFESSGRWELSGRYYTWSTNYKMSESGICNTSLSGDTFYLVMQEKDRKIVMGYNTRFFDYKNR